MKSSTTAFLLAIALSAVCYTSQAASQLVWVGKITYVENGWDGEGLAIHSSSDGPPGCSADLKDFGIDKSNASYKELVAMALTAYSTNADVELIVDSGACTFGGRTKVIAIRLKK